jgi:PAS domain S-box-containing protein
VPKIDVLRPLNMALNDWEGAPGPVVGTGGPEWDGERIRALVDNAFDVILVVDAQAQVLFQNEATERAFGYSPNETAGHSIFEWVHPEDRERTEEAMVQSLAHPDEVQTVELRVRHRSGAYLTFEARSRNLLADPLVRGIVVDARDVTQRKKHEDALRRSQSFWQATVDSLPLGVAIVREDGHILAANAAWKLQESQHGMRCLDFSLSPGSEEEGAFREGVQQVFQGSLHELDFELPLAPDGDASRWLWLRVARLSESALAPPLLADVEGASGEEAASGRGLFAAPLVSEVGAMVVVSCEDITQRKRNEGERARAAREHAARQEAQRAQRQSHFLARAGELLAGSLDFETTLNHVAQLAVPFLADWCFVDLMEGEVYRRVAVAHADESQAELARSFRRYFPLSSSASLGVSHVMRTGRSEIHAQVSDDLIEQASSDRAHADLLRALDVRSSMSVALKTRGRTLGAITFISSGLDAGRTYTDDDLLLAEDLARVAALAVDNARLFSEAENANRSKDEFLAVLSHELRTPLTPILGWVYLLREDKPEPKLYHRALEIIETNARAQERLIEDLIDVSRIVAGKLSLERRALDLAALLAHAVQSVRESFKPADLKWKVEMQPGVGRVLGDEVRLRQAIGNLLSNAVKFTPEGGTIQVRLDQAGTTARVTVQDSGQGISPEFLPRLFERFEQADSSTARRSGGLGLGLTIVRHIARGHGGEVRAHSEGLGRGSVFVLELPLLSAPASAGAASSDEGKSGGARVPESLEGARVLVVDDEADARELLDTMLSRAGAIVRTAASAPEAWELFDQWRPEVLVCDLAMPGEDGFSLIRRVRALPAEKGGTVPAAAITAYARPNDRAAALAAGFDLHVPKPIDPAKLASAMIELLHIASAARSRS